jgi:SAM-dependent methyltransferase
MAHYTPKQIRTLLAGFRAPDRAHYPELAPYTRDELYEDFFGGGGLYLATHMVRTLRLKPGDIVLDLGCGKGPTSIFLARHFDVKVVAVDLWTSATFLNDKFAARGYRDRIMPLNLDVTRDLPFAADYFDAIFCLNSFSFYGGRVEFLQHLLKHLKPGGQLCIGSEVLSDEFTAEQLHVEHCTELDDADAIYEELVRHEYEHNLDPFDVDICLQQIEWGRTHRPRKTLFVLTARKR